MLKRNNRKGFTLAELLIVVAIIAVLVAIAVPLFVGSLSKAREARDNANIRAVRGAAVVYLLENSADEDLWATGYATTGWDVSANISSSGEISNLSVTKASAASEAAPTVTEAKGTFTVTLHLDYTEIGDKAATEPSLGG